MFAPDPDIFPLIRRLAAVLRAEGEDLVADNILLQSQRLGAEARELIDAQRRRDKPIGSSIAINGSVRASSQSRRYQSSIF